MFKLQPKNVIVVSFIHVCCVCHVAYGINVNKTSYSFLQMCFFFLVTLL